MTPSTSAAPAEQAPRKKPRLALALATAMGTGYFPKAPGTIGSLVGIIVAILSHPISLLYFLAVEVLRYGGVGIDVPVLNGHRLPFLLLAPPLIAVVVVALLGVWSASRVAEYAGTKDPQHVVIDEVSGMHLTLVLAILPFSLPTQLISSDQASVFALYSAFSLLNWKYLLLGFILFRVFDIWKPWPVHRLEKLPGGWGIMADDWMAGLYAAILLRLALYFGLLSGHIG
jgi:phosphatidylglycerophosphatase A